MPNYGVQIEPQFGYSFDEIYEICSVAEKNGFTHAWFSDHFMLTKDAYETTCYECFTAMMAAASKTTTLRLGSLVFCNSYRHPAVLAKQIASLDHYSRGRIEFGYGAGWKQIEYEAYGIPFPSTRERIERVEEGLMAIKKLWTERAPSMTGRYYSLREAVSYPKPLQQPHPPIWVGSMKAGPKMLEVAVKHATGINVAWAFSPEQWEKIIDNAEGLCEKYDRDPRSFKFSYGAWTKIYDSEEEKERAWKEMAEKRGVSYEDFIKRYDGALHGTPEEITEQLKQYIRLGLEDFIFMFPQGQEIESLKRFKEEILPKL